MPGSAAFTIDIAGAKLRSDAMLCCLRSVAGVPLAERPILQPLFYPSAVAGTGKLHTGGIRGQSRYSICSTFVTLRRGFGYTQGGTGSSDYPVTPGAFQTTNFATLPPVDNTHTTLVPIVIPPPNTGYVTELNATGTGLVFSTFIGGSGQDVITPDSRIRDSN